MNSCFRLIRWDIPSTMLSIWFYPRIRGTQGSPLPSRLDFHDSSRFLNMVWLLSILRVSTESGMFLRLACQAALDSKARSLTGGYSLTQSKIFNSLSSGNLFNYRQLVRRMSLFILFASQLINWFWLEINLERSRPESISLNGFENSSSCST